MKLSGNLKAAKNKRFVVILILIFLLFLVIKFGQTENKSPILESKGHGFNIVSWEIKNLPAKFFYKFTSSHLWRNNNLEYIAETKDLVVELEGIFVMIRETEDKINQYQSQGTSSEILLIENELKLSKLIARKNFIRNQVEEYVESLVSKQIKDQKLSFKGLSVWPPVDFRIDSPPKLLVISPRNTIIRLDEALIDSKINTMDTELIEKQITQNFDLSAIVIQTGGLSTYPSLVPSNVELLNLLETVAHEWLHAYLIFFPLGRSYFSGGEMLTINETLANMFGEEIGLLTFTEIKNLPLEHLNESSPPKLHNKSNEESSPVFSYDKYMNETRKETDILLSKGLISEAEKYMENRRIELNTYGYNVRKINQAYFAFYGSYADTPHSTSPIYEQLLYLRKNVSTIGELVDKLKDISTHEEFESLLSK